MEKENRESQNPENPINGENASSGTPPLTNQSDKPQENTTSKGDHYITFHGSYKQYLGLSLYNLLLTFITLGLYYPWAKCAIRKFMWQETEIGGSRFEWHGTGKEMFRGFIKAYLIFGGFLIIINFGPMFLPPDLLIWVVLASYFFILALIPLAIHGMMRYRLSRTSLRGIHLGYRGDLKEFYKRTSSDFLYTIFTFGIYGSWLQINMRKYVMRNSRYGDVSARFKADGGDFLLLIIAQTFFIIITIYLYIPWAIVRYFKFYVENTILIQDDKPYYLRSEATGGGYFIVLIKGVLLTIVTLGICGPIAKLMIHKYLTQSISLSGQFDFDSIRQTEKAYTDATGDDMADILDMDF